MQEIRNMLTHFEWQQAEPTQGGITWIELYIVYILSGGKERIMQRRKAEPLAKPEAFQTALADFKRRMRKVVKHNVKEEDEYLFQTSYARANRLEAMAVQISMLPKQDSPGYQEPWQKRWLKRS